jgi:NTP pyrophosphatase (non-canonical NTP hydrolase)
MWIATLWRKESSSVNKISYEERAQVYCMALDKFGSCNQLVVAIEEMSEVQKEICKAIRGKVDMMHLAEEVADATIMLEQIRLMFGINGEVCAVMDAKVERLRQKIEQS